MNAACAPITDKRGFVMQASAVAKILGGRHQGQDVHLNGVSTDTRTIRQGQLFVALHGPNFDAHDFISQAVDKGAACCLAERSVGAACEIIVEDSLAALGQLAKAWRSKFRIPVIAITGSNGKTTVKEMLAGIMRQQGEVLATKGNLNNDIGMPLTLLELDAQHDAAIIEMGANHAGEIAYLTAICQPDVAIITNAGPAHLEGFGSIEGVSRAKGEIFDGLSTEGTAIINADDQYAAYWLELVDDKRHISFGLSSRADVSATYRVEGMARILSVSTPKGKLEVGLQLLGQHNVMNALAAIAAAMAVDVPLDVIRQGLESVKPVPGRLQMKAGMSGSRVIDDTYNANPLSLQAALDVLSIIPGSHYLALGDMGELGPDAEKLHAQAGRQARDAGVERLFVVGELAKHTARAFGENAYSYSSHEEMIKTLIDVMQGDVTLLVKGSRLMHMEKVVKALSLEGGEEK